MNDWQKVRLGDVCKIIGGGTPKTTNRDYWKGNIPWLSVADFNNENRRVFDTEKFITQKGLENSSTKLLNTNDIIISARGTVGALAQLARPMSFNQSCYGIRATENTTNDFLYYAIKNIIQTIKTNTHGSVFDTITRDTFDILTILLPPLPEQKHIASILSALDDKIELNNRMNKNLEAQAQAIFKSWFVDFEPWGGVMPQDWREGTLDDVATLNAGGDKPEIYSLTITDRCAVPVFSNGLDQFGLFGYTDIPKVTEESVTISARGTIGFVCLREDPYTPIVRLISAIPKKGIVTAKYLYLFLKLSHISGVGTTQQQLTIPDFKKYILLIPVFEIIVDFTNKINGMFELMRENRVQSRTLATLRDTLLPKLMNGEIDLKEEN